MLQSQGSLTRLLNMALWDNSSMRVRHKIHRAPELNRSKHVFQYAHSADPGTCILPGFKQFSVWFSLEFYYVPQFFICVSLSDNFHSPMKQFELSLCWRMKPTGSMNISPFVHIKCISPLGLHKNFQIRDPCARWGEWAPAWSLIHKAGRYRSLFSLS